MTFKELKIGDIFEPAEPDDEQARYFRHGEPRYPYIKVSKDQVTQFRPASCDNIEVIKIGSLSQ